MKNTLNEELLRYKQINKYVNRLLNEQDVPDPTAPAPDATAMVPDPSAPAPDPTALDTTAPTDMKAPATGTGEVPIDSDTTEEMDITDLVNMTKSIKKDLENKQDNSNTTEKMDSIFTKLTDLETKLQSMDSLISKIDSLSTEIQNVKPKTPEEKLEMRSLDSYPFNKSPQEFFGEKQDEMRTSGKNEYILTKNDVQNYSKNEINKTFNPDQSNY